MRLIAAIFCFLLVCIMGLVIGLAGGVTWGNADCGLLVTLTFFLASFIGGMVLTFPGKF